VRAPLARARWRRGRLAPGELDALADPDPDVQRAAVNAFRESCANQPLRWAHSLFHPLGTVRALALADGAPAGAEKLEPFLLADPETKAVLVARMAKGEVALDPRALSLLLPLWRSGELDADAAFGLLASLGPKELFLAAGRGSARSLAELGGSFPVLSAGERDGFDEPSIAALPPPATSTSVSAPSAVPKLPTSFACGWSLRSCHASRSRPAFGRARRLLVVAHPSLPGQEPVACAAQPRPPSRSTRPRG
jgi:hypothetical protein